MEDISNLTPIDPSWDALADRLAEDAAKQLGGMVLFVVMQPAGGKTGITLAGVPSEGLQHEMAQDVPRLLMYLAAITKAMDEHKKGNEKRDKSH